MIFGVLAVVLATSLGVSYYEVRRAAELLMGDRLASLSRSLSSMFELQIASRVTAMHRIAADTAVLKAVRSPAQTLSPAAVRALAGLMTPADVATPPVLMTVDGRQLGNVRLETPGDASRMIEDIRELEASADSAHVGRLYASGGHASFWLTVSIRHNGELLGYLIQERRMNSNPRDLGPFRGVMGTDISLFLHNATDDRLWVSITGAPVPPPT
jgi:hypothetical protein